MVAGCSHRCDNGNTTRIVRVTRGAGIIGQYYAERRRERQAQE
jgi:hypothetical protein